MVLKKKEVTGDALIDLGANGQLKFESILVYMNEEHETDLTMSIVDKYNANNKIMLNFSKPKSEVDFFKLLQDVKSQANEAMSHLKSNLHKNQQEPFDSEKSEIANRLIKLCETIDKLK